MEDQAFKLLMSAMNEIRREMREMRSDIRDLSQFKWKIAGGLLVLVSIFEIGFMILRHKGV